jgi:serine/threonine protein kinase
LPVSAHPGASLPKRPDRAGTPGFRAPEVLLGSNEQGVALDVWAAGAVLLSLFARRYPFFPASARGDEAALLQLAQLLGAAKLQRAAAQLRRRLDLPADLASTAAAAPSGNSGSSSNHGGGSGNGNSSSNGTNSATSSSNSSSRAADAVAAGEPAVPLGDLFAPALRPRNPDGGSSSSSSAQQQDIECARLHRLASELALRTLEPSPFDRATAAEALLLPFISSK